MAWPFMSTAHFAKQKSAKVDELTQGTDRRGLELQDELPAKVMTSLPGFFCSVCGQLQAMHHPTCPRKVGFDARRYRK